MKQEEECINIEDDEVERMEVELAPKVTIPIGNTAFDVQFQLSAESLKQEPDAKGQLLRRLNKFFFYNRKIEPGRQHFNPRLEPAYHSFNVQPIPNILILFGSDFKKFKVFKAEYNTTEIYKINDSNCRLVFSSFQQAWASILKNAKDPSMLVMKVQGQNSPIPQCWFEMKSYNHLERVIDVQVRFATSEDLQIYPEKEDLINSYKDSKEIFNNQENRKNDEEKMALELKKQKLEFRKQKNSENLYKNYEMQNKQNNQWKTGKNSNPGANRNEQRSRSRSREKENKKFANENEEDAKSNYSYGLNKQFNKMTIGDTSNVPRQQELDLSFDMQGGNAENNAGTSGNAIVNAQAVQSSSAYNWKGSECSSTTKWSYREYIKMKEKEEDMKRKKLISVVIID